MITGLALVAEIPLQHSRAGPVRMGEYLTFFSCNHQTGLQIGLATTVLQLRKPSIIQTRHVGSTMEAANSFIESEKKVQLKEISWSEAGKCKWVQTEC